MDKKLDLSTSKIFKNDDKDIIEAMSLIGQEIYISDDEDFESYQKFELAGIRKVKGGSQCCYIVLTEIGNLYYYKYFILAKDAKFEVEKEKKLRPFKDIEEFFKKTENELGKVIRYRKKKNAQQVVIMINGYTNDELVIFGGTFHSLTNLFENYEYYDNDNTQWKPFGVEE